MKSIAYLAKGTNRNQGTVIGQRYGVSRDLNPKEYIDYIHVGIIAYRKMITESCGQKFNEVYVHEYGGWVPPRFGAERLLGWFYDRIFSLLNQKLTISSNLLSDRTTCASFYLNLA